MTADADFHDDLCDPVTTGAARRDDGPRRADLDRLRDSADRAATLLKTMGNSRRLMILCKLVESEKSVGELEYAVGLPQSVISQHLARLRRDALVTPRRAGKTIYYSVHGREAEAIIRTLYTLFCAAP